MTDRVYPSAKTNGTTTNGGAAVTATTKPTTAAKPNLYNPTRPHPYRPQPNHSRRRHRSQRSCVCLCCFWSFLFVAVLILLAAIAGCAVYVLYSPRRPAFSVAALRISRFNLSTNAADDTTRLTAALNLTISAKNPNKKIIYTYDPISITALTNQVLIANGSFPFFHQCPQNTNNYSIFAFNCFGTRRCRFGEGPEIGSEEEKWVGSENFDGHKSGGEDGEIEE
ncbi:hypothetical protein Acr_25g0006470 [Actinidia rufa]|uniref:Late embryogenesis abundant (LEA) hydroxyproline-rich glycoprotein family n=1 Tax=Actinidia rufa TaxID=165716 RepID=A0A7J0GZT1_9ERIC|nr:hypothetical protein Acr_25g0006470 [Actinidia rufa]